MRTAKLKPLHIIRPRIVVGPDFLIGPGKIDLLRAIDQTGSISAAARSMTMSYKRAWSLIDELNRGLSEPVVLPAVGGRGGGGARLTEAGRRLIDRYAELERDCARAATPQLRQIQRLLR